MPKYEYLCYPCAINFTKERSILEDEPKYFCEKCNGVLTRQYTPFGVQFNSKGFYSTDNKKV
jgi:putative FmdB family regulatory protein